MSRAELEGFLKYDMLKYGDNFARNASLKHHFNELNVKYGEIKKEDLIK